ncbi:YchJ family protein [Shewanella sp. TC10]|uniref:YchJ family protein n=1 Tax=Shewanella sp. TC10 TaxID=1419739 RepID=UPI00129D9473|nr:YchJ family protein [Shewanella sp. TC10]
MNSDTPLSCPCDKPSNYIDCCQPYHLGHKSAENVESLMRSRYSAFALHEFQYLLDTHHPDYINGLTLQVLAKGANETQWLGLDVVQSRQDPSIGTGTVTFKAWYLNEGHIDAIYECSQFKCIDGNWYYTEGEQQQAQLPKRNDKCICHSGKKFKACCMKKQF